jgi:type II secretory pathway pseudopilin PulG
VKVERKICRHHRGYLLLEVLLALAILSFVVAMVFRIVQATLTVTADVTFLQTKQQQVDGLFELLQRNFCSLPEATQFQTRARRDMMELIFRRAPFHFTWSSEGPQFGTVVISPRSQADGRLALCVLHEPEDALESYVDGGKETTAWVPLVTGIEQLSWRFYDVRVDKWLDDWRDLAAKPSLVEINFRIAGRQRTERGVFRWPVAQSNQ